MAAHSPAVIKVLLAWRTACSMGGLDGFKTENLMSGSFLQSSRLHRISNGYYSGHVAGWCDSRHVPDTSEVETHEIESLGVMELLHRDLRELR